MEHSTRIGIIGAGAAGLSAAHFLKHKGYRNITLFEADTQVGGKCRSITLDGHTFDVGAVIATMGYNQVMELARHYQVPMICAPRLYAKSITTGAQHKMGFPPLKQMRTLKSLLAFALLLYRTRATRSPGHTHLECGLDLSIHEWLKQHRLEDMQDVIIPFFTGFGYGYQDAIPTAYLLKMCELTFANSFASNWNWLKSASQCVQKMQPHHRATPVIEMLEPLMFEHGYQSLFEVMAQNFTVKLNTRITRMSLGDGKHTLHDQHQQTHELDRIIIATPPQVTAQLLAFDAPTQHLFNLSKSLNYHVFLTEHEQPLDHEAWFLMENTANATSMGRPVVVSQVTPGSTIGTCYAYSDDDITQPQMETWLEQDCARLGIGLRSIRKQVKWQYFPHIGTEHFKQFYQSLENIQGKNGLYFSGEIACFTTVEHVVDYSRALVERFF